MRITPNRQNQLGLIRSQAQNARLADLRNQITSGIRVNRPSDDPQALRLILSDRATSALFESQVIAISDTRSILSESHVQLRAIQQFTVNARDIGLSARSVNNQSEASVLASELDGLLNAIDDAANSKINGNFLFAGAQTNVRPYENVGEQSVYQGSVAAGITQLAGAGSVKTFYAGSEVFTTGLGGTTSIRGTTGALPGIGTASGHGNSELLVQHTATFFGGSSGIQAGLSTANDTVIGQTGAFRLQIQDTAGDGSAGFVSLNNGQQVAFTSADTDLQIVGPEGHLVHLDLSNITPGFDGEIDLTATGTISLDGGVTELNIDFSNNQTLVDPQGNVHHFNTQEITRPGRDTVQLTGNTDLFETLRAFRDDLNNYNDFSIEEWNQNVTEFLREAELSNDHLLDVIGEQSVDLQTLDRIQERGETLQFEADRRLADLQGTDFVAAATELQLQQNVNQFTLATLASVFQVSVLDFI